MQSVAGRIGIEAALTLLSSFGANRLFISATDDHRSTRDPVRRSSIAPHVHMRQSQPRTLASTG